MARRLVLPLSSARDCRASASSASSESAVTADPTMTRGAGVLFCAWRPLA